MTRELIEEIKMFHLNPVCIQLQFDMCMCMYETQMYAPWELPSGEQNLAECMQIECRIMGGNPNFAIDSAVSS